ncbi:NAD(P)-binding protein [Annulohypoxylon bovei var. microspora]|nr:NAD(P)-binding protein [Annulohypoxylon bovei var. microspora]
MSSPVWFITGASHGFGLILCLKALKAGHRVVGSVRSKTKAADAVKQIEGAGGQVIELDMNESKESIDKKIKAVGQIDYLINNAGFFILGAIEQATEQESRQQMQTNFFGPLYVLQAALPGMRSRRAGTIVNVSSIASKDPQPASGLYSASKAALEALSESLAAEVAPFNVGILMVEPGAFRTNFLTALVPSADSLPAGYAGTTVDAALARYVSADGTQRGDPDKGVDRIYEAVTGEGMAGKLKGKVLRLVIGPDSLQRMRRNNDRFLGDLALQEDVALSTDF